MVKKKVVRRPRIFGRCGMESVHKLFGIIMYSTLLRANCHSRKRRNRKGFWGVFFFALLSVLIFVES